MAINMAAANLMLFTFEESFTKERIERVRKQIAEKMTVYPGDAIRYSHVGTTVIWAMGFLLAYLIIYIFSGRVFL
jgi:hypothetical protein